MAQTSEEGSGGGCGKWKRKSAVVKTKDSRTRLLGLECGVQAGTSQFSSVTQSCLTLCNPMNHSTPGLPVHHQFPEFTQTLVHRVSDAIQASHPLSPPSPPAPSPSQHQVFSSESALRRRWPKSWSFSFSISPSNKHPGLISFRMDWLDLPRVFSNTTVQKHQFFSTQLSSQSNSHIHT